MKATEFRLIADDANKAKREALEAEASAQVQDVYEFISNFAKEGLYSVTYRKPLNSNAVSMLNAEGFKVHSSSSYSYGVLAFDISWHTEE